MKNWSVSMAAVVGNSVTEEDADKVVFEEMDKDFEKMVESRHKFVKYGLAKTYFGKDNDLAGWTGYVIDFVNPVDLVTGVSEIELQVELILESQDENDPILKEFYKTQTGMSLKVLMKLRHMGEKED
jgi:hypothetical protein